MPTWEYGGKDIVKDRFDFILALLGIDCYLSKSTTILLAPLYNLHGRITLASPSRPQVSDHDA